MGTSVELLQAAPKTSRSAGKSSYPRRWKGGGAGCLLSTPSKRAPLLQPINVRRLQGYTFKYALQRNAQGLARSNRPRAKASGTGTSDICITKKARSSGRAAHRSRTTVPSRKLTCLTFDAPQTHIVWKQPCCRQNDSVLLSL